MKSDANGCSMCEAGKEHYERYYDPIARKHKYQYDYRAIDGMLFSCVSISLEAAREKRDHWLKEKEGL